MVTLDTLREIEAELDQRADQDDEGRPDWVARLLFKVRDAITSLEPKPDMRDLQRLYPSKGLNEGMRLTARELYGAAVWHIIILETETVAWSKEVLTAAETEVELGWNRAERIGSTADAAVRAINRAGKCLDVEA